MNVLVASGAQACDKFDMKLSGFVSALTVGILFTSVECHAALSFYDDAKPGFLEDTGATNLTSFPSIPGGTASLLHGGLTFTSPNSSIFISSYSTFLAPENVISLDGLENLRVDLPSGVFSVGFDFSEGPSEPLIFQTFVESTFRIEAFAAGLVSLGSYDWQPNNDVPGGTHFGVWSDQAIVRLTVTEIVGAAENEFYGRFQIGHTPMPIPEPTAVVLVLTGSALLMATASRRRA